MCIPLERAATRHNWLLTARQVIKSPKGLAPRQGGLQTAKVVCKPPKWAANHSHTQAERAVAAGPAAQQTLLQLHHTAIIPTMTAHWRPAQALPLIPKTLQLYLSRDKQDSGLKCCPSLHLSTRTLTSVLGRTPILCSSAWPRLLGPTIGGKLDCSIVGHVACGRSVPACLLPVGRGQLLCHTGVCT